MIRRKRKIQIGRKGIEKKKIKDNEKNQRKQRKNKEKKRIVQAKL